MTEKKPFEIARETLKQITTRKLMPTPVNYQAIYNELAGTPTVPPFPADALRDIAQALPAKTPGQQKQRGLLEYAIDRLNWDGVKTALVAYGGFVPPSTADSVVTGNAGTNAGLNAGATAVATTVGAVGSAALTADFMGQVGRLLNPTARASRWMLRMSATTASSVAAMSWCITIGSSPSTKYGV